MRTLLLPLASLAVLAACTAGHAAPSRAGALTGTEWTRTDDTEASPHYATISFTERRASGYTGCRTWFATPTRSGDQLHFGGVTTTGNCDVGAGRAAERSFLSALHGVRRAVMQNEELVFSNGSGHEIARFSQANAPDRTAADIGAMPPSAPADDTATAAPFGTNAAPPPPQSTPQH